MSVIALIFSHFPRDTLYMYACTACVQYLCYQIVRVPRRELIKKSVHTNVWCNALTDISVLR